MRIATETARSDGLHADTGRVERRCAVAGIRHLRGIGSRLQFRLGIAKLHAKGADAGIEAVRPEHGEAGRPFFGKIAVIGFDRTGNTRAGLVEWFARNEVHRARDGAFDHVGGVVLEHLDAAQQLWRNVIEAERAAAIGGKDVATIQLGPHEGQPADDHARPLDREPVRIVRLLETADVHAGHALQRFGHRTIGQRADILCGDHVDECIGVTLQILRAFQRGAEAADDDDVVIVDRAAEIVAGAVDLAFFGRGGGRHLLGMGAGGSQNGETGSGAPVEDVPRNITTAGCFGHEMPLLKCSRAVDGRESSGPDWPFY